MRPGWEIKTLGDLAVKITDGSHNPPKGVEKSEYLMLSSQNVWNGYLDKSIARHLSKQDFLVEDKRTCARKGDVLLTIVGTIGRTCVLSCEDTNITFQRSVCIIKPKPELNPFFLSYQLQFKNKEINEQANGAAQKGFYLKQVERLSLVITSLPEQQRIVDILDQEFTKIDALKDNAERSLQAAKDLFQATMKKELKPKEGWETDKLKNICKIKPPKKEAYKTLNDASPVSFLPMEDLKVMDFDIHPKQAKPLGEISGSYTYFAEGDVLLAKVTPCFENGKQGIARHLTNGVGFGSSEFIVYRPGEKVRAEFLYYYLASNDFRERGKKQMHGACGLKRLAKEIVEDSVVSFPDPDSQDEIVRRIRDNEERTTELQRNYEKTLSLCDDLKQALLRKAFNGEL